jgi:hypothetical protein
MAIMDRVRRGDHDLTGLPDDLRRVVAAALEPEPAGRPALADIRSWLTDDSPVRPRVVPPSPVEDDPFTIPLALAAHEGAAAPTWVASAAEPVASDVPLTRHLPFDGEPDDDPDDLPLDLAPAPRESRMVRLRRGIVIAASAVAVGATVAAWPYWGTVTLLAATWLLRTCTMTATAAGERRRLRGVRWYDVLVAPLSAPWYLVAAVPGAVLLGLWSIGIAAAGILLGYAAGISLAGTLFLAGLCLAVSLWLGPGAAHVRWPMRVVAQSLARRTGFWAFAVVVLVAYAGFVGHQSTLSVGWAPLGAPPHVGP